MSFGISSSLSSSPRYLSVGGSRLAYHAHETDSLVGVLFLPGFQSTMDGTKALFLEDYCRSRRLSFVRFDYRGHGLSWSASACESNSSHAERRHDLVLTDWIEDAQTVLRETVLGTKTDGVILVGSSMGVWIALRIAMQRRSFAATELLSVPPIKGIVGMAAAPDFTREIWNELPLEEQQRLQQEEEGIYWRPSAYSTEPYPIPYKLVRDAAQHELLTRDSIPLGDTTVAIRLLHGLDDPDVSWTTSVELAKKLECPNVVVSLIKNGDHRLSTPSDCKRMVDALSEVFGEIE